MTHWIDEYMGKPYVLGATGPESYDCLGLLKAVYRDRFGIELGDYKGLDLTSLNQVSEVLKGHESDSDWERVFLPKEGDAVAFSQSKLYHHVGIFVDYHGGYILHTAQGGKVTLQSRTSAAITLWNKVDFYRHATRV